MLYPHFLVHSFIVFNMTKLINLQKKHQSTAVLIISFFCFLLIIIFSAEIGKEIRNALDLCLKTIIPSLFSMLTLCFFLLSLKIPTPFQKATGKILNILFGLSSTCTQAVLTGLLGGYNTAPNAAKKLRKNNRISPEEAKRLVMFFSSPGISFSVNITGIALYNSISVGLRLFLCGIITDILFAFVYNRLHRNKTEFTPDFTENSISVSFTDAVSSASKALISICSWILLFSAIKAIILSTVHQEFLISAIELLSEVSSAVTYSARNFSLPVTAFSLYFGGFSVFLQQFPDIIDMKISPILCLAVRFSRALTGSILVYLSCLIPIGTIPVFSSSDNFRIYSANPIGSLSLLLLCAVFIADGKKFYNNKKKQQNQIPFYNNRTCP